MSLGPKSIRVRSGYVGAFPRAYGAHGELALPSISLGGAATNIQITGALAVPFFVVGGRGIEANGGDVLLSPPSLAGDILLGGTLSGDLSVPALSATSDNSGGGVLSCAAALPTLRCAASIITSSLISGELLAPLLVVSGGMHTAAVGAIALPSLTASGVVSANGTLTGAVVLRLPELVGQLYTAGVGGDYAVWVVNQANAAHSIYTSFDCYGIAKCFGRWFGVFSDGVYELVGDDDAGDQIDAKVYWAPSDLGTSQQKRVDALFANLRSFGQAPIRLVAVTDEQEKRVYTKDMTGRPEGMRRHRQLLTRGLQGQIWQFGFENVGGGDFVISDIDAETVELSRKVK